jgi:hypothetical protein
MGFARQSALEGRFAVGHPQQRYFMLESLESRDSLTAIAR